MVSRIGPAWEQGALLSPDACPPDLRTDIQLLDGDLFVIISKSCDVQSDSFKAEPLVEVHIARAIADTDGNYTNGKHPRFIDIEDTIDGEVRRYRIADSERRRFDRRILQHIVPLATLNPAPVRMLANWTARRFVRPALPDAFNQRRKLVESKIAKVAAKSARNIATLYVILEEDRELDAAEVYHVFLIGTVLANVARDTGRFEQATKAVAELARILNGNGISVVKAMTKSEDQVSLTEAREMIRLDLEYISVREGVVDIAPGEA